MDESLQLLEDCEARSERCSDWELQFLDSIRRQLEEGRRLSQKQEDRLSEIWEKVTKKG